ncbi:MAG: hypothetical protein AAFQ89_01075, partial [Cyanobacteria bacterium J06626_18]
MNSEFGIWKVAVGAGLADIYWKIPLLSLKTFPSLRKDQGIENREHNRNFRSVIALHDAPT